MQSVCLSQSLPRCSIDPTMLKIADLGTFETVPPFVTALQAGDVAALDAHLAQGCDIEAAIALSQHTQEIPLVLALALGATATLRWLVEHGANLNRADKPAFPVAARYADADTLRYLAQQGADIHAQLRVGGDAYQQALYGKRIENLPIIDELGHAASLHAGRAFRSAVFNRDRQAVEFFLAHGVDVNYQGLDQVFPDGSTPLLAAARKGDMEMCRLLVEHGANVLLTNRDGDRPYTVAVEQGKDELAGYFKSLEPADQHDLANKLRELKPYKLPPALLDFLQGEERRIDLPDCGFGFVDFFALTDTVPLKAGRKKLLRLSRSTGDYSSVVLVWNPKAQVLGYWDIEHAEYGDVAAFGDFMDAPSTYMNHIIHGSDTP